MLAGFAIETRRADIDGLRAVAIVSVLVFHAGFSQLPGGFVGVDVFFVISGYLMTRIILRDLDVIAHPHAGVVFWLRIWAVSAGFDKRSAD